MLGSLVSIIDTSFVIRLLKCNNFIQTQQPSNPLKTVQSNYVQIQNQISTSIGQGNVFTLENTNNFHIAKRSPKKKKECEETVNSVTSYKYNYVAIYESIWNEMGLFLTCYTGV